MKILGKAAVLLTCGAMLTGCRLLMGTDRDERMLEYMNARYPDSFSHFGSYSVSEILVSSEKYPDKRIWVMEYEDNPSGYTDNYLDYVYEKETEQAILGMLEEAFGCPAVLTYRIPERGMPCSLSADCSLEEYLDGRADPFIFFAVISPEYDFEEADAERRIIERFGKAGMNITVTVHFPSEQEEFDRLRTGEQQKLD